ncbi:MAG TPA: porin [Eoetvoesiella sp.]
MKKTLLVAALAVGFAGVAHAETSVTLYGIADAGIGYEKRTSANGADSKRVGLVDGVASGNRWGLKGAEDLGNGLQAVFQLESGYDITTGSQLQSDEDTDRLFGRHATIGLKSASWGQLDFGRQTNIGSKYGAGVLSPFGAGFKLAKAGTTFTSANTNRLDNMAMYQTPSFSGFQFGIGYSFGTDGTQAFTADGESNPNDRAFTTGLRYANGPLAVALTYDQIKFAETGATPGTVIPTGDFAAGVFTPVAAGVSPNAALLSPGSTGTGGGTAKAWNLGASYDFEVVKLHLGVGQERDGTYSGYSDGADANAYTVGLSAPIGAGKLMASWGMLDPRGEQSEGENQQAYSLGYTYALSKRTDLYALGSYVKDVRFNDGAKSKIAAVGVRHAF